MNLWKSPFIKDYRSHEWNAQDRPIHRRESRLVPVSSWEKREILGGWQRHPCTFWGSDENVQKQWERQHKSIDYPSWAGRVWGVNHTHTSAKPCRESTCMALWGTMIFALSLSLTRQWERRKGEEERGGRKKETRKQNPMLYVAAQQRTKEPSDGKTCQTKVTRIGVGETSLVRALPVLAEERHSVPSTHKGAHDYLKSHCRDMMPSSNLWGNCTHVVYWYTHRQNIHTYKKKLLKICPMLYCW